MLTDFSLQTSPLIMYSLRKLCITHSPQLSLKVFVRRQLCSHSINLGNYSIEHLEERGLLRVQGKEASTFLQGLVTNDMRHIEEGAQSMYTMFLNIRGRVMCDTIIYKEENNSFLLECDKDALSSLQKHLKMYRVRKKIDINLIEEFNVWVIFSTSHLTEKSAISGSKQMMTATESDSEHLDSLTKGFQQSKIISRDPRLAELGYRLIIPSNEDLLNDPKLSCGNKMPNRLYRKLRYKFGVGEGTAELPPGKCFPLELNCDFLHGVSFHKGCYIGQELTARVHHTGVVRKRLMPILLNSKPLETDIFDAPVENALDKKAVGKLRGLENTYGLALLKVNEALAASALQVLKVTGTTWKPTWWPQEAPKERLVSEKSELEVDSKPL